MSSAQQPVLWIFGGPNGSGKSSVTKLIYASDPAIPRKYINADDIAKEHNVSNLQAANMANAQREAALMARESFAMETVLSMPDKVDIMRRAKGLGYTVRLIYVTTQDPKINVGRVDRRHQAGGHDVPVEKIFSRYDRSMRYLPEALAIADAAYIFNNSFENPVLIAEKAQDRGIIIHEQAPPSKWTRQNIMALIGVVDEKEVEKQPQYYELDKNRGHLNDRDDR